MAMTKKERAAFVDDYLHKKYPETPIPLDHKDPYTLLIAVLLSAQCTDIRVNLITPKLFAKADNPFAMSQLSQEIIADIIRPCGLAPSKSKAIADLSQILVDRYDGQVPADMAALESLPGVGHKTAQVVMAQCFGLPTFPVDTHIHRLIYRWGLSNGKRVEQTERDCKRLLPEDRWNDLHLQIIYFGRQYCPARGHTWSTCPLCSKIGQKNRM